MKRNAKLYTSIVMLISFLLWTVLIRYIDVGAIGPNDSVVGFSTINNIVHKFTGTNMILYTITDWLGLIPFFFAFGFAMLGLCQWIKRKHILKVDIDILILGIFYLLVFSAYIFFEYFVINYRPVLINGYLEASYPSSTTMLVLCVIPTAIMQFNSRIKNKCFNITTSIILKSFIIFMVIGRLISGVHWISDIIGGVLFSISLVTLYSYVLDKTK